MRRLAPIFLVLLAMEASAHTADLENLYLTSQWFRLRDASGPATPDFYRGAVAASFNDPSAAERYLGAVIKSGSDTTQRVEAGILLEQMYIRLGRRKAAAAQLDRIDTLVRDLTRTGKLDRAASRHIGQIRAELAALSGFPDQTVVARGFSRLPYFQIDNQLLLPLTINGLPANYYLDSGSSASFLNEDEAKRLGLIVHPLSIPVESYGGHSDSVTTGIAVAHDLVIGNIHLRDVAFLVDQDEDHAGLLGLPLLLTLQSLRWSSDGMMEIGFPAGPRNLAAANLCLDSGLLVTEAGFGSEKLNLFVDTGTPETLLFPTFADQFRQTVSSGAVEPFDISGANHDPGARTLASLTLHVGGSDVTAGRIHALSRNFTEDGSWAHGNLGTDFAGNAAGITLDFQAMRLTIEGGPQSAGNSSVCPVPANFACLPGFTCTVRYDPEVRCHIDRIPVEAPVGNALGEPDDTNPATSCALPVHFSCPREEQCMAAFGGKGECRIDHIRVVAPTVTLPRDPARITPAPPPGPDARELIERSLKFESLELAPAKDYVYTDDSVQKILDADGAVKKTTTETHEVMTLYDQEYERLVRKDGKPLPPAKERAEQARFDKAVEKRAHETPEAKAKREDAARKAAAKELVCGTEFLKLFQFRLDGSGEINGRPAWIVEVNPLSGVSPACDDNKLLAKLHFRIWIDQAEYRWAQLQGDNVAPITWGKLLLRIPTAELHFTFQQLRLADGVWMASSMKARIDPRLLVFARLHLEVIETYSNYRKFQSDSRVVPLAK